jgi:DNA modification methylase
MGRTKRDIYRRQRLFHRQSFAFEAKANLYYVEALLSYLPDALILDPMAGIGSTFIALDYGLPVICGELETHRAQMCEQNRQQISIQRLWPHITPSMVCQWDVRDLPFADDSIPSILFSPPYFDAFSDWHIKSSGLGKSRHARYGPAYGDSKTNVGNLHVFENYLYAMRSVYAECLRVLQPGGKIAVILKDKIRRGWRLPVVSDNKLLLEALDASFITDVERETIPSLYANTNLKNSQTPVITDEHALIFTKSATNAARQPKRALIIETPRKNPNQNLFLLKYQWAKEQNLPILCFDQTGTLKRWPMLPRKDRSYDFRLRKANALAACQNLIEKHDFRSGDHVELHMGHGFARYFEKRLKTLGIIVENPLSGHNYGQKLKFYKENTNDHSKPQT